MNKLKLTLPEIPKLHQYKSMIYRATRPNNTFSDFVEHLDVALKTKMSIIEKMNSILTKSDDTTFITEDWFSPEAVNYGVENLVFKRIIVSAIEYIKEHKQLLYLGSPFNNRSFQLSQSDFFIREISKDQIAKEFTSDYIPYNCFEVVTSVVDNFYICNINKKNINAVKHMIIRPKIVNRDIEQNRWEVKLIHQHHNFIIDNIDR